MVAGPTAGFGVRSNRRISGRVWQQDTIAGFCSMYAWPVSAAGSSGRFRDTCGRLTLNTEFLARLSDGRRGAIMHDAFPLVQEMHDAFPLVHDCSSPAPSLSLVHFIVIIVVSFIVICIDGCYRSSTAAINFVTVRVIRTICSCFGISQASFCSRVRATTRKTMPM